MSIQIEPGKLKEIAEYLDMGMLCFYNKTNGELESYPEGLEDSGLEEEWAEVTGKIETFPDHYWQIEKMQKREAFELMESFLGEIDDIPTRKKFTGAISGKKPFARFKDMLSNYPDLRECWFAFKLQNDTDFIKRQLEKNDMLNDPIKGFYIHLEYHLSRAFQNSTDKKPGTLWCDGVWPVDNPVLIHGAIKTKRIETQAIMGWVGNTRQEKYEMVIKLGPGALKNHEEGLSMINCLPSDESLDWVTVDSEKKTIELQLN